MKFPTLIVLAASGLFSFPNALLAAGEMPIARSAFGGFGAEDGKFGEMKAIAAIPGNAGLLASDTYRVQTLDLNGAFVSKFGQFGDPEGNSVYPAGTFSVLEGVATDGTYVYTTEYQLHRVQKFTMAGTFVTSWGGNGTPQDYGDADGKFYSPRGIAVGPNGLVYVVDENNHRVQVFDSAGVFQFKIGSTTFGTANGQFSNPMGIAINQTTGQVYVADYGNNRIQRFSASGVFEIKFGISGAGQLSRPTGMAIDSFGRIYAANGNTAEIYRFSADGEFDLKFGVGALQENPPLGVFAGPNGMAVFDVDGNERLAIVDELYKRGQIFDLGTVAPPATPTPSPTPGPTATPTPVVTTQTPPAADPAVAVYQKKLATLNKQLKAAKKISDPVARAKKIKAIKAKIKRLKQSQ